jgi:hypothetical protein
MRKPRRTILGLSVVEVTVASAVSVLAIGGAMSVFLSGMSSWATGSRMISAQTKSDNVVALVVDELREATFVAVAGDGRTVAYRKPAKDASGDFVMDVHGTPVWDGRERTIYWQSGSIYMNDGANPPWKLASNVILTDPKGTPPNAPYKIFTAGAGANTREVTVKVVIKQEFQDRDDLFGRKRQSVYLRNIPDTVR